MAWAVTFRGHALDSTNGISVETVTENAFVNVREQKLKEGGSSLDLLSLSARTVTLKGTVNGETRADFSSNLRALQSKFSDPTEGTLILDVLELPCVAAPGPIVFGPNILSATWSCRFISGSKFWKSASARTVASAPFGTTGAPSVSGTLDPYTADYAETFPTWTLKNNNEGSTITGLNLEIRNNATTEAFEITNFDLGDNDILTIDPTAGQIYISFSSAGESKPPQKIDGSLWALSGVNPAWTATVNTTALTSGVILTYSFYTRYYSYGQ